MGREITTAEVLTILAEAERGISAGTWRAYVARGQAPAPARRVGNTPVWDEDVVRAWTRTRPGQGARTDLKQVTTEYGSWNTTAGAGVDSVLESVAAALGEFAGDYDLDGIAEDYQNAINAALDGTGVSLHGREFYGPYPHRDVDIRGAVEGVDFWEIAARHER